MIRRLLLALSLFIICAQPALALSNKPGSDPTGKSQRYVIEKTPWLDKTACSVGTQSNTGGNSGGGPASPGQTWFMGDSLTYGLKDFGGLEEKLTAKGFTPNRVNDRGGRAITSPGGGGPGQEAGTGLETVSNDADFIKGSKNIVIALGTNDANIANATKDQVVASFSKNQQDLIDKLKALPLQPDAKIFWVDVAAVGVNKAGAEAVNTVIYDKAQSLGYTPISQFKFVWGKDQDPKSIASKSLPDPNGLLSSDGIHYAGGSKYQEYATFLVDQLATGGGSTATAAANTSSGCQCPSGSTGSTTILQGGDNIEKAFNFFVANGLTPLQAAGIVGNLMAESNVDPTADNDINGGHHGIAQWDQNPGGRYANLVKFAQDKGVSNPDELGIQLEFLLFEMPNQKATRGKYTGKNFLEASQGLTTPTENALAFEQTFERSNNEGISIRTTNAESVFASFGSNSPTPGGTTGGQTGTGSCGGGSNSTIDPTLPQGTAAELFEKIKTSGKITSGVDKLGVPGMKATILAVVLKLTEKYSFSIGSTIRPGCGCPHANGSAVDLGNINSQGVPSGYDYEGFNQISADFIKDAVTIIPAGGSYMGTPNARFEAIVNPVITAKGGTSLIETSANGLADGAHFHLNVPASAP